MARFSNCPFSSSSPHHLIQVLAIAFLMILGWQSFVADCVESCKEDCRHENNPACRVVLKNHGSPIFLHRGATVRIETSEAQIGKICTTHPNWTTCPLQDWNRDRSHRRKLTVLPTKQASDLPWSRKAAATMLAGAIPRSSAPCRQRANLPGTAANAIGTEAVPLSPQAIPSR